MDKEIISIARKLVDALIKRVKPKEKYEEVIEKISSKAKRDILFTYNCSKEDLCGVFGKYSFFKTRKGKEHGNKIIDRIARAISKKFNKVVITGERLYYFRKGKVKTTTIIINKVLNTIKKHKKQEDVWRATFSKIMGLIPEHAIFLIDNERSSSTHEEHSFHIRERGVGVAVIIPNKKLKPCRTLERVKIRNLEYSRCIILDYENCIKKGSGCLARKLKINLGTLEPFIRNKSNLIIFVEDLKNIHEIINQEISQQ